MIKKNENLTDAIQVPLIRLVCGFKLALQSEDYELCGKIKIELDRRERLYGINKKALKKILDCIRRFPSYEIPANKQHFDTVFEKYL
jgi:hypothetical protein